jgi:hypothetical protein
MQTGCPQGVSADLHSRPELSAWMVAMTTIGADKWASIPKLLGDDARCGPQRLKRAHCGFTRR